MALHIHTKHDGRNGLLIEREKQHNQICIHNLSKHAPGPAQSGQRPLDLTSGVIEVLGGMRADNVPVESVALTHDYAEIVITDPRGLDGSETIPWMATMEQRGEVEFKGHDREILDDFKKNPAKFQKMNEEFRPPRRNPDLPKPLVVTYNVSREAPGPYSRQSEVSHALEGFVEELKRLKTVGATVLGASFTPQTSVITVDSPKGL